jgi:hypothetical protein
MILSENDKWLILSPGRTGSKMIVDCLYSAYREANLPIKTIMPQELVTEIRPLTICHSHSISSLSLINQNVKVVLSARDMVESALSWCIYPKLGKFHLYPVRHQTRIEELQESIPAFYLPKEDLFWKYKNIKTFYDSLAADVLARLTIIDYEDIKNDPAKVYDILGVTKPARYNQMAIKNPGTHEQWITNWDEISKFIAKLERTPLEIFKGKM